MFELRLCLISLEDRACRQHIASSGRRLCACLWQSRHAFWLTRLRPPATSMGRPGGHRGRARLCRAYLGRGLLEALALGISAGLQYLVRSGGAVPAVPPGRHPEAVGVRARGHLCAVPAKAAVELVEDAVVLVQVSQLHRTAMRCEEDCVMVTPAPSQAKQ